MTSIVASDTQPILVPREIVNADSVFVVRWILPDGTRVEPGAALCEIETSKAVVTVEAEHGGYLRQRAAAGDEVCVGGILGYLTVQADTPLPADAGVSPAASAAPAQISAKARRKIDELDLDPALFAGYGLVREQDVLDLAAQRRAAERGWEDPRGPYHLEPLGPIQRRVARVMEESVAAIPAAYLERRVDLAAVRSRARALGGEGKTVVSEVDLVVAAVGRACVEFPHFNAFVTPDHQLHIFEQVSIGVAVDVEGDLYVVVVRDAARKTVVAIAKELRGMQYLAQRRRLTAEHLSGGTITVTSMIGRGIHRFQPIPYPHQAAIVGIADAEPDSTHVSLAIVFDHRVANGAQAAAFLSAIDAGLCGGVS
jgi:pyruvate dehydrogenase E2 component (dihydrolipoamide acetyltransferase)